MCTRFPAIFGCSFEWGLRTPNLGEGGGRRASGMVILGTVRKSVGEFLTSYMPSIRNFSSIFTRFRDIFALVTAHCTLVQIAVLRSHVVRPSVCLSVALVICDHIRWKSWKLLLGQLPPIPSSLFVGKRRSTYSYGNMGKFWGDEWVGKKWHAGEHKRQYL